MRFSTLIVSGSLAVLAAAAPAGTETSAAAPAQTTSVMDACLNKCPVNDVNCKAHCIAVPSPDQDQANATTECSRKCPQGSGSPEDTQKFADCLDQCRKDHFYKTSVGTPEATGTPSNGGNGGNNGGDSGNNGNSSNGDGKDGDKSGDSGSSGNSSNSDGKDGDKSGDSSNSGNSSNGDDKSGDKSGDSSNSGNSSNGDKSGDSKDGDKKADDKKSAASGIVASTAALFGAVVALLAL